MNKRRLFFVVLYVLSVFFLVLNLNFNVRTFRLTQVLQALTLDLHDLERDVTLKEITYYKQTNLEHVYNMAKESLGMVRQSQVRVFTNDELVSR